MSIPGLVIIIELSSDEESVIDLTRDEEEEDDASVDSGTTTVDFDSDPDGLFDSDDESEIQEEVEVIQVIEPPSTLGGQSTAEQ
jgi:hypothetical protein